MTIHTCSRCGYTTDRKQNLKLHLLKKKTCPSKFNETSICDILKSHGFDEEAIKYENICDPAKIPPISAKIPPISAKIQEQFQCRFCANIFTRKDSLIKHELNRCKSKENILNNQYVNEQNKFSIENHDALVIQVENLMNEVAILKTKNISKISNNINNINNNINKGIVNNIVINNYGSENIDYITFSRFVKLLETPLSAISKLIELKYFNEKHPENHNIKITNIHDKFAKIYKDKKWLVSNKKDIIFSPKVKEI
jgi:hypothetical protein